MVNLGITWNNCVNPHKPGWVKIPDSNPVSHCYKSTALLLRHLARLMHSHTGIRVARSVTLQRSKGPLGDSLLHIDHVDLLRSKNAVVKIFGGRYAIRPCQRSKTYGDCEAREPNLKYTHRTELNNYGPGLFHSALHCYETETLKSSIINNYSSRGMGWERNVSTI